jgi:hypothetical protein
MQRIDLPREQATAVRWYITGPRKGKSRLREDDESGRASVQRVKEVVEERKTIIFPGTETS